MRVYNCNEICFKMLKELLTEGLVFWQNTTDLENWHRKNGAENYADIETLSSAIGKKFFQRWLHELETGKILNPYRMFLPFPILLLCCEKQLANFKLLLYA